MERQEENAHALAQYLETKEGVEVFYTGLDSHPGHQLQNKQARGHSGVFSFLLSQELYDLEVLIQSLKLFGFAVSLGGVESLISRPSTMTHESYSPDLQEAIGIKKNLLRLAVGIESVQDLQNDLEQAFEQARR